MAEYEFMLVIDSVDDHLESVLTDEFEGFVGGHGHTTLLTVSFDGVDAVSAAQAGISRLHQHGVHVHRVYDDLVARAQIAERAGVTRQAAGMWARGERQTAHAFPEPFVLVGGGLWRWHDVNDWLRQVGLPHDEVDYPSAADVARINTWQRTQAPKVGIFLSTDKLRSALVGRSTATMQPSGSLPGWLTAADSKRTDFALGA